MADKVYIVTRSVKHPGTSIWAVFTTREKAENCIKREIERIYPKKDGWIQKYPDKNDKKGYIWLEKVDGIPEVTWMIQTHFLDIH